MDTLSDIADKQRAERRQIRSDAELLSELTKHPGWSRYLALVEAVAQNYYATVMKPLDNVFEVGKIEFAKGALNGLSIAAKLPTMKINEAKELRGEAEDDN